MKGYKAFNKDLTCRDFQFEIGKTYSIEGELKICNNGFHFCEQLKDVYNYYSKNEDTRICKVEAVGELLKEGDKSVTSTIKILEEISKDELLKLTDNFKFNTGSFNTGNSNTGSFNTGNSNTGSYNTGHCNTGSFNTGYCNTGYYNTGSYNTGDCNTGYYNTGYCNTGYYNTGNYNTGDCNTDNPTVRLFNKDSGWNFNSNNHLKFKRILNKYRKPLLQWVYEKDMSDEEKKDYPSYKTTEGYLKKIGSKYNGKEVTKEDKEFLESVPNFCPKILEECTGIILENPKKTIIIDGKTIEISEESFNELKKQLTEGK